MKFDEWEKTNEEIMDNEDILLRCYDNKTLYTIADELDIKVISNIGEPLPIRKVARMIAIKNLITKRAGLKKGSL